MAEGLGWMLAMAGLGLGSLLVLVPGAPGAAVAWLGLAGFAVATDFAFVSREAVGLLGGLAVLGTLAQGAAPWFAAATWTRSVGALGGALAGVTLGMWFPVPLLSVVLGSGGLVLGAWLGRGRWVDVLWGPVGGCAAIGITVVVDALALMAQAAVFAMVLQSGRV